MLNNEHKTYTFVSWGIGVCGIIVVSLFLSQTVFAENFPTPGQPDPNPTPPINTDPDPCRTVATSTGQSVQTGNSNPGTSVPVNDSVTHELLGYLVDEGNIAQVNSSKIGQYLYLLCRKEYNEDKSLQHAWANLIGEFVKETVKFITRGYEGNPAFIDNQDAYYQLVNIATARVFMQDVVDSNIDAQVKRDIILNIAPNLYSDFFPYTGKFLADNTVPDNLSRDGFNYNTNPYWQQYIAMAQTSNSSAGSLTTLAEAELAARQQKQLDQEQEKLNWGRGFFSYEVCDLAIYRRADGTINPEDRRNCRIVTPGALIQDQTSFVFGTALRQMEVADEYEEWIAPNTLAAISDILSYRGLNSSVSRNANLINTTGDPNVTAVASPPNTVRTEVPINSDNPNPTLCSGYDPNDPQSPLCFNPDGPLPYEFNTVVDWSLWKGNGTPGEIIFGDVLDTESFRQAIGSVP